MRISACVITKNEEKNIAKSIASYRKIADEIIVVDSGSDDRTVEIAENMGASVFKRDWTGDFASAKNFAIEKATGDWILFLDADEFFEEGGDFELKKRIASVHENKEADAINLNMKHFSDENGTIFMTHKMVRVFRNSDIRYKSKIHEYLSAPNRKLSAVSFETPVIFHSGYIQASMPVKFERNLEILRGLSPGENEKCDILLAMAECYNGLKRHQEAIQCIDEMMRHPRIKVFLRDSEKALDVYKFKIEGMQEIGRPYQDEEIESLIDEAIKQFPTHPEAWQLKAGFFFKQNRMCEAIDCIEKAIHANENYSLPYLNGFNGKMDEKYAALGDLYRLYKGDLANARDCYEKALEQNNYNLGALNGYMRTFEDSDIAFQIKMLGRFYDQESSDDVRMIITSALLCGMVNLFTTYFRFFADRWPEKLTHDKVVLGKVQLMKKDFQSVKDMGGLFGFIAAYALGENPEPGEYVLPAVSELLETGNAAVLKQMLYDERYCTDAMRENIAAIFENHTEFGLAMEYYALAGLRSQAARMAYLSGDFKSLMYMLEDPASLPEKKARNMAAEILALTLEKEDDPQIIEKIKKLQERYKKLQQVSR